MAETNWSLEENGATIADVSNEATHVASSAANLLSAREDLLWITGDAPQYVTIELSRSHPPLLYAGWHVWHDYLTNPKTVELSSGETRTSLSPLIICQALPGEGTQVWRLPGSGIPSNHLFVRFRITETFGPGPTYMNNVVLLAADPGPNFQTGSGSATAAAVPATGVPYPAVSTPRSGTSRGRPPTWSRRDACDESPTLPSQGHSGRPYEPLYRSRSPTTGTPGVARSDDNAVGLFRSVRSTSVAGGGARHRSVSGRPSESTGRMSQLLRDLDDDIKLLKPIKSVSPTKNMLLYVPQDAPQIPPMPLDDVFESVEAPTQRQGLSSRSAPSQSQRQQLASASAPASDAAPPPPLVASAPGAPTSMPAGNVYYLSPPPNAAYADVPKSYQDRLATLEQAVASLTQSVQHQRDDLTMIKRLLLQQATERRREAERRLQSDIAAPPPPPPPPLAPSTSTPSQRPPAHVPGSGQLGAAQPRPHYQHDSLSCGPLDSATTMPPFSAQHVAVDFPEDALRSFVQSVMAEQIKKHTKKSEARVLHRLDEYLQDVVESIANSVDDRVRARLDGEAASRSSPGAAGSAAGQRRHQGRGSAANTSTGSAQRTYGDPNHPISIVKDSSFDTSGSGARLHRY